MGLFGGDSSSSTVTKKNTSVRTTTDESVTDIGGVDSGGVAILKKARGRQVINFNGIQTGDIADLVGELSGGQAKTAAAVAAANSPIADIAKSLSGTQSEAGALVRSLALPVAGLVAVWLWMRR